MNRRDWIKTTGALGVGSVFTNLAAVSALAAESPACSWESSIARLKLRHTWTTTMSSSEYRDTIQVRLMSQGITGVGEGAPIIRYHETAEGARDAVESLRSWLISADPWQFQKLMA